MAIKVNSGKPGILEELSDQEGFSTSLVGKIRNKVNKELAALTFNTYFPSIPLDEITKILGKYNIVMLQEDDTEWSGFLCGDHERTSFNLADMDSRTADKSYTPFKNACLTLSWYKMPSGRYEINTYVS